MRGDDIVPALFRLVQHTAADIGIPGIVDEDIDRAECFFDPRHRGCEGGAVSDVERVRESGSPYFLDLSRHLPIARTVPGKDGDRCTRMREAQRDGAADSAITPGDDRDATGQIEL